MRIAQIAPLIETVPPPKYGGTERIVSVLTEELTRRGHEVTLFATGDSRTNARLIAGYDGCLRMALADESPARRVTLQTIYHLAHLGEVCRRLTEFDVIHSHLDALAFPLGALCHRPFVLTSHGRLDLPELQTVYRAYPTIPLVAISHAQRASFPDGNWVGTVYNAIRVETYTLHPKPGAYLAFLGRICPDKGIIAAIDLAIRVGLPLKIAAKVDPSDREYFETVVRPRLSHPLVEYIGEIDDVEKNDFLGNALAYLFPIDWPEPFGITMIEAMACGTPVIAMRRGSVPEVVVDGETGFVCDSLDEMAQAIEQIETIDRRACRRNVEERFSQQAMVDGYEAIYRDLVEGRTRDLERKRALEQPLLTLATLPTTASPSGRFRSDRTLKITIDRDLGRPISEPDSEPSGAMP